MKAKPKDPDAQRRRIVDVARELFFKRGINTVTMDDVARALRMSKRTLYQRFADKEELLLACHEMNVQEVEARRQDVHARTPDVMENILHELQTTMDALQAVCPLFLHDVHRYPRLAAAIARTRKAREEEAVSFLQRGVAQGVFRKDVNYRVFYRMIFLWADQAGTKRELLADFPPTDIFLSTFVTYLRGCTTDKGRRMLDDFLRRYQQAQADASQPPTTKP